MIVRVINRSWQREGNSVGIKRVAGAVCLHLAREKADRIFSPKKALLAVFWEVERDIFSTESISPIYPVFLLTVATVPPAGGFDLYFFKKH